MRRLILFLSLLLCAPMHAHAQSAFGGGVTAFDPEIRVVNSGAVLDAQATVSSDMKYVTITARPTVSQLTAMRQFSFNAPPNLGFVGSPAIRAVADRERGRPTAGVLPTPSPLDRRGITKLD